MTEQLKAEAWVRSQRPALKLPTALPLPVKYDGINYFWGVVNEMIADQISDYTQGEYNDDTLGEPFRIRGWGRIQYMQDDKKTPHELQVEVGYWIAKAINAYAKPSLQDWLAVLDQDICKTTDFNFRVRDGQVHIPLFRYCDITGKPITLGDLHFNLTTGQPATEGDYKIFNDIVGV